VSKDKPAKWIRGIEKAGAEAKACGVWDRIAERPSRLTRPRLETNRPPFWELTFQKLNPGFRRLATANVA
jgi:hypothetical protein